MSTVSEANVAAKLVEETDPRYLRKDLAIGKSGHFKQNDIRLRREKVHRGKGTTGNDTPSKARMTSSDVSQNVLVTGGLEWVRYALHELEGLGSHQLRL